MVEHPAVNRTVLGSSPSWGARQVKYLILLLLLLCACRTSEEYISNKPIQEICTIDACGTFCATGPHSGVSASHVCRRGFCDIESGGRIVYTDITDRSPAQITFAHTTFTVYYNTTTPVLGIAKYITLHGTYDIYLYTDRIFGGPEPIHGDSGSPVIQNGKVVGVVTHSIVGGGLLAPIQ